MSEPRTLIALLDSESTGLDPRRDEPIAVALQLWEIHPRRGTACQLVDRYDGLRQPQCIYPTVVQHVTRLPAAALVGTKFDLTRITRLLSSACLVVAHNASFERELLGRHIPALESTPWACAMRDIDWRREAGAPSSSLDALCRHFHVTPSTGSPANDCSALATLLSMTLPVRGGTGFQRLLMGRNPRHSFTHHTS